MGTRSAYTVLLLLLFIRLSAQADQELYHRVKIDLHDRSLAELAALGLEADHGTIVPGEYIVNEYSESELELLSDAGFHYELIQRDMVRFYQERAAQGPGLDWRNPSGDCAESRGAAGAMPHAVPKQFRLGTMAYFYTYEDMLSILDSMRLRYPHLITSRSPVPNAATIENRPIYWLRISDNPDSDESEPEVLYTALHHAREPNSLTQLIYYMWYLLENYGKDPMVTYLVNNTEMYFMPCVNPDGYIHNQTSNPNGGGMWRKNRRRNTQTTVGVDLNRNYGHEWGHDNIGSSPSTGSQTYRGEEPFSEPETRAVRDFCLSHEFMLALNHHTYGNLLVYPWGYSDSPPPDSNTFQQLANVLTRYNGFIAGTGSETVGYTTNGDADDWMYGAEELDRPIIAFTPELGKSYGGFWPSLGDIVPNCQSTLWMNLSLAHATHNFGVAEAIGSRFLTEEDADFLPVRVTQYGLRPAPLTVSMESLSPGAVVTTSALTVNPDQFAAIDTGFQIKLSSTPQAGEELAFLLKIDNGQYSRADTIRYVYYGKIRVDFIDPADQDTAWTAFGPRWGLTTENFYSAPSSWTDSPNARSDNNLSTTLSLRHPIGIGEHEFVKLYFWARWDIEEEFDFVQLQMSTNGGEYVPLCGRYTVPGSNFQGLGKPVYDGRQHQWVQEEIDLTGMVKAGDKIQLRFWMRTDNGLTYDGFYFDDLTVIAYDSGVTHTQQPEIVAPVLNIVPNPNRGSFSVQLPEHTFSTGETAWLIITNGRGNTVRRIHVGNKSGQWQPINLYLLPGIYSLQWYTTAGHSAVEKFIVTP